MSILLWKFFQCFWYIGIVNILTMSWSPDVVHRVVAEVGDVLDDGYDAVADPAFFVPLASRLAGAAVSSLCSLGIRDE